MMADQKGSGLFLNWRLCLQTSGIYRLAAIPGCYRFNRRGRIIPPLLVWPRESALRVHPCRALSSAPVSISVEEELVMSKL